MREVFKVILFETIYAEVHFTLFTSRFWWSSDVLLDTLFTCSLYPQIYRSVHGTLDLRNFFQGHFSFIIVVTD